MDSRQPNGAWKHVAGDHGWVPVKCASVGWLVADDEQKKVLAPNMGDIDDASNIQLSGEIVIPTSCVIAVKRLLEVTASVSTERAASKRTRQRSSAPECCAGRATLGSRP